VATPGGACLPPAGAFTISIYWYIWLLLKFCSDFAAAHMRLPRPALPSFHVEMALCSGLHYLPFWQKAGRALQTQN
jgi:hypothetical protein